jgi:hypothetical protein
MEGWGTMSDSLDDRIRDRAFLIWEAEGRPYGRNREHWLRAAAEIAAEESRGDRAAAPSDTTALPSEAVRPGGRRTGDGLAGREGRAVRGSSSSGATEA